MSSFGDQSLFDSGAHVFRVGGLSLRHVLTETPGGRGVQLTSQGRSGRAIEQTGTLIADDVETLDAMRAAIEALIDGQTHELIDDTGRRWPQTVMLSFEPGAAGRLGTRWQAAYRIQYLQVTP